jgi:hypothetical protein
LETPPAEAALSISIVRSNLGEEKDKHNACCGKRSAEQRVLSSPVVSNAISAGTFVVIVVMVVLFAAVSVANTRLIRQPSHGPSTYVWYCTSRGYQFVAERDGAQAQYAGLVPIFGNIGYTRSWRNEISGTFEGRPFVAFEYMYATRGTRYGGGRPSRHAVVKWDLPGAGLPYFNVLPADYFQLTPIAGKAPASTLTVPGDPAFSEAFIAVGEPAPVERLLTPELRAALIERSDNHLAGQGDLLFWWLDVPMPGVDGMDEFLEMAARMSRLIRA